MFADMKSSTSIAETLGHIKYFEMLRTYYFDLSNAIVNNLGGGIPICGRCDCGVLVIRKRNTKQQLYSMLFHIEKAFREKIGSIPKSLRGFPGF